MTFSRYFRGIAILLALTVGYSSAAANKGKIRYVAGGNEAEHQKKGKGNWTQAKFGAAVGQKDNFRTGDEAQIIIALSDGSSLTINERTQVSMEKLFDEGGVNQTTVNIINGKVNFDAQKQANGSSFKFKTNTATAAIRGTDGVVGTDRWGRIVAGLRTGKLTIEVSGKEVAVNAGQTALSLSNDSILVVDMASSGDSRVLDKIDTLLASQPDLANEQLIKELQHIDSVYLESKPKINCSFSKPVPDTLLEPGLTVNVLCDANVAVGLNGTPAQTNGQSAELSISWARNEIGPKKFMLSCYLDSLVYFPCGEFATYYKGEEAPTQPAKPLTITTSSPIQVCNPGTATIEGVYDPAEVSSFYVRMGTYKTGNLISLNPNGMFSHTIVISDKKENWNEDKIYVEYQSNSAGPQRASIDLDVKKSCKAVNQNKPTLTVNSYDSLQCALSLSMNELKGDENILTTFVDGTQIKEATYSTETSNTYKVKKDLAIKIDKNKYKGQHDFTFEIRDLADNKSKITKKIGCYPTLNGVSIHVSGGTRERLSVPPSPPQTKRASATYILYRNLNFDIVGLPGNDPIFIKKVEIAQKGKATIILRGSDLTSNTFDQQVELLRGQDTTINIKVTLKSGQILNAQKIYEVR